MNCSEVREKLGCYSDHALEESERHDLDTHLKSCRSCASELESLRHLDSLMKVNFYSDPPAEYWKSLPRNVITRLGLRQQRPWFDKVRTFVDELAVANSFKWGLASAAALVTLTFLVGRFYLHDTKKPGLSEPQLARSNAIAEKATAEQAASVAGELKDEVTSVQPELNHSMGSDQPANSDVDVNRRVVTTKIERLPVRFQKTKPPATHQALYPIPNIEFDLAAANMEDEQGNTGVPQLRTLALKSNVKSKQKAGVSWSTDKSNEQVSSFSETLAIVQQINSLDENRNIWLSYLDRETDPTYRALGIYNLALTLSKIVEVSNDSEKAREALNFFKEHEKSLRFQLGNNRYQLEITIFDAIIKK
jgi:hypothetical protein